MALTPACTDGGARSTTDDGSEASMSDAGADAGGDDSRGQSGGSSSLDKTSADTGIEDSAGDGSADLDVYRTEWITAVQTEFPGDSSRTLFVGGSPSEGNFINRGDIEVYYTTTNEIRVDYRKFIVAESAYAAEVEFDRFRFWSWAHNPPKPPRDLQDQPELECTEGHWQDECHIRAWYEGQLQPDRLGMDFRVYLPEDWAGLLILGTQDNLAEDELYPDRGDVTVKDTPGALEIYGEGGRVNVSRAKDTPEVLNCSPEELRSCHESEWEDIGSDACVCDQFGTILVDMRGAANVNINLNNPSMLTQVLLNNLDDGLQATSDPLCEAFFDCESMDDCEPISPDDIEEIWSLTNNANVPWAAQTGIGFHTTVDVKTCEHTQFVDSFNDFGAPKTEARGFINVCANAGDRCPEIQVP